MFFYCLTYSQIDQFNLTNNTKFDSLLTIKKQVDKKLFDKNYYSIQVFSGSYNLADSISKLVTEKYPVDSAFFYFETPNYKVRVCLLYTSPSPRDRTRSRMPSSA